MNRLILAGTVIIILLGAVGAWFFLMPAAEQPPATEGGTPSLPGSGSFPVTTSTSQGGEIVNMQVPITKGGSVQAIDFIHNGVTLPDEMNEGRYLLAGDLGYCVTDPAACQAGGTTAFNIFYDSTSGAFTIALLEEPLGQTRLAAEQYLMKTLGVTQQEMCALNYYVGTTSSVNPRYDSGNLGFSFCPGATVLPK